MSNLVRGNCFYYKKPDGECPFGKPICTALCDYKPYVGRFLKLGIEWKYVVRFFKMYRRWQKIYWEKYIFSE